MVGCEEEPAQLAFCSLTKTSEQCQLSDLRAHSHNSTKSLSVTRHLNKSGDYMWQFIKMQG